MYCKFLGSNTDYRCLLRRQEEDTSVYSCKYSFYQVTTVRSGRPTRQPSSQEGPPGRSGEYGHAPNFAILTTQSLILLYSTMSGRYGALVDFFTATLFSCPL